MNYKKIAALGASLAVAGGMIVSASGFTGAYFSQTKSGTITGTVGSVSVSTTGGNNNYGSSDSLDFNFPDLMPGTPQSNTINYTVTGSNKEDIYLVFPNAQALHSLNNMGTYGEVHVQSNGTPIFDSANLNDGLDANLVNDGHCGPQSPSGCWALPSMFKLASNVAPGNGGTMTFAFGLAAKTTGGQGANAFCYPLVKDPSDSNPADQICTSTSPSYGLPYQIVATQPGIAP